MTCGNSISGGQKDDTPPVFSTEFRANFTCKSRAEDSNSDGHEPNKRILLNLEKPEEREQPDKTTNATISYEEIKVLQGRTHL